MSEKRTRKSWTTTIYTDLFIGLKELSETTRIPVSKLTDEAIEDLLKKYDTKEKQYQNYSSGTYHTKINVIRFIKNYSDGLAALSPATHNHIRVDGSLQSCFVLAADPDLMISFLFYPGVDQRLMIYSLEQK